jgi:hypothetical protein
MGRRCFSRGVSDHVRGRGLGTTSGHFGWSLTPRSPSPARQYRDDAERSAKNADRRVVNEKPPSHIYLQRQSEESEFGWLESDPRGSSHKRGNTPREGLFPLVFPLRESQFEDAVEERWQ